MKEKQIRAHRTLASHQSKLNKSRQEDQDENIPMGSPERFDDGEIGGGEHVNMDGVEEEDHLENPEALEEDIRLEELTHAEQLEKALGEIGSMNYEDFFDHVNEDPPEDEERDEWLDWTYDQLDRGNDGVGPNFEPEPDEPFTEANDKWYPFKNKMAHDVPLSLRNYPSYPQQLMSAKATSMVNHSPRAGTSPFKVGYGTSDGSKRLGNTMCVGTSKSSCGPGNSILSRRQLRSELLKAIPVHEMA
ncbi:hypothetical protein PCANC_09577 [Puccinia coronata f. sp. avenae]|uniref:Uncharacterized protein n=1 Tax=Puccinia coronata f. sp. avenae TaxID=200324 RepID=A0A2N5V9U7_9BASI|nr:hypothetical protein PCANC_09577 [Puccinia coronata f. sp. avenae]